MNCPKCGAMLKPGDAFCTNCGTAVNNSSNNMGGMNNNPINTGMNQQVNSTQPTNNFQQPMPNYNNQPNGNYGNVNNNMNKSNQNNNMIFAIVGIVLLVAIALGVYFFFIKGKDEDLALSTTAYKVDVAGYTVSIPDDLIYQQQDGDLVIANQDNTWAAMLFIEQTPFSQLKNNMNQLPIILQSQGCTAKTPEIKTIKDVEYLTMEVSKDSENHLVVYAAIDSMNLVGLDIVNIESNDFDYDLLKELTPIVKSIKTASSTNAIKSDYNFVLNKSIIENIAGNNQSSSETTSSTN